MIKTVEEMQAEIARIEKDDRYLSGLKHPAEIAINAPLALVQLEMEIRIKTLRWVLGENYTTLKEEA